MVAATSGGRIACARQAPGPRDPAAAAGPAALAVVAFGHRPEGPGGGGGPPPRTLPPRKTDPTPLSPLQDPPRCFSDTLLSLQLRLTINYQAQ